MRWFPLVAIALLTLCAACASSVAQEGEGSSYGDVLIKDVPHIRQKPDFCGEACVAMALRKLGHKVDQDVVFDASGLDPARGRGCYTAELKRAMTGIGYDVGTVWFKVDPSKEATEMEAQWRSLYGDLARGYPSIICTRYDASPDTTEHFRLILGYDKAKDEVIYHEPAEDKGAYRRMDRGTFLSLWPLKYSKERWTVIRFRLKPGKLAPSKASAAGAFTDADYAQHIMKLKKKVPAGFTVVVEKPFVVIGNDTAREVRRRATNTVRWAVTKLKALYFKKDPTKILDVWLFKDGRTYRYFTKRIFDDEPDTPYGYYSPRLGSLIMNIGTGGGTLVHEIVHPFMESNFPNCPSWFNEGMGSLYEQSGVRDGKIRGLTNWRLKGLKRAIEKGSLPSFKKLCSTTRWQFYTSSRGDNYAQARYLCYYLQDKGLLVKYYHAFHKNRAKDPTGYDTLVKILGEKDMDAFKKRWEAWAAKLKYPPSY